MDSTIKAKTETDLKHKLLAYKAIGDSAHAATLALGSGAMKDPAGDRVYRQQLSKTISLLRKKREVLVQKLNLKHQISHRTKDLETLTEQVLPKQVDLMMKTKSSTPSITDGSVKSTEPASTLEPSGSDAVKKPSVPKITLLVSAKGITPAPGVRYYSSDILHLRARVAALTTSLKGEHDALRLQELAEPPLQLVLLVRQLTMQVDSLRKLAIKLTTQAAQRTSDAEFARALQAELRSIGDVAQKFVNAMKRRQEKHYGDQAPVMKELRSAVATQRKRAEAQTVWLMAQLDYVVDNCMMPGSTTAAAVTAGDLAKKPKSENNIYGTRLQPNGPIGLETPAVKANPPLDSATTSSVMEVTPLAGASAPIGYTEKELFKHRVKTLLQTLLNESIRESIHASGANEDKHSEDGEEGKDDGNPGKSLRFVRIKPVNDPAVKLLVSYNIFLEAPKNPHLIRLRPFGMPASS